MGCCSYCPVMMVFVIINTFIVGCNILIKLGIPMSVHEYLGFLRRVETRDVYVRVGCAVSCDWGMLRWIPGVIVVTAVYRCLSK